MHLVAATPVSGFSVQTWSAAGWLRDMGGRIAIDDVGAGYSGLRWLIELEPEIVKVDMALIRGLHLDPRRRTMTRSIATLGRELGAVVVAGIDSRAAQTDVCGELRGVGRVQVRQR